MDELRTHHALHYTARNSVLSFAGAIDPEACAAAAQNLLGTMPTGETGAGHARAPNPKPHAIRVRRNQTSQTDLRVAFRAPGERAPDEPAAEALLRMLDDGMSTRLYARVCDEKGLCYDVSADYETFEDDGVMDLAAVVQHTRAPVVMRELCEVVKWHAVAPPMKRWTRCVAAMVGRPKRCSTTRTHWPTFTAWQRSHASRTPQARHDELMGVTRQQVREVARRIFRPENLSAVAVGLLDDGERRAVEQAVREFKPVD